MTRTDSLFVHTKLVRYASDEPRREKGQRARNGRGTPMHKWKAILFAGAASVFLIQPAQAQSEGESAPAADGADRQGGLGEIVVTARRQEERLQDVPIAVSVVSQEQMDQRGSFNPVDLVQRSEEHKSEL